VIVVDSNVISSFFVECPYTRSAKSILLQDARWVAPLLWRSELRNTLVKLFKKGVVDRDDAIRVILEAESLMSGGEYHVGSADVLDLAIRARCSAYDAEFVVLARELGVPLVTTDRELLDKFPGTAVSPEKFLAGER
jgi:predicted nucleic acid-binding protein